MSARGNQSYSFGSRLIFWASSTISDTVNLIGNIRVYGSVKTMKPISFLAQTSIGAAYDLRGKRIFQQKPIGVTILRDSKSMLISRKVFLGGI
jgi:hypothetical protein